MTPQVANSVLGVMKQLMVEDAPRLVGEIKRLRAALGEMETDIAQAMLESGETFNRLPESDARLLLRQLARRIQRTRRPDEEPRIE